MHRIGERLRKLRKSREMSQVDLARLLGLSRSAISSYENGTRTPDNDTLIGLASLFQVSIDFLLGVDTQYLNSSDFSKELKEISDMLQFSSLEKEEKGKIVYELSEYLKFKLEQNTKNR